MKSTKELVEQGKKEAIKNIISLNRIWDDYRLNCSIEQMIDIAQAPLIAEIERLREYNQTNEAKLLLSTKELAEQGEREEIIKAHLEFYKMKSNNSMIIFGNACYQSGYEEKQANLIAEIERLQMTLELTESDMIKPMEERIEQLEEKNQELKLDRDQLFKAYEEFMSESLRDSDVVVPENNKIKSLRKSDGCDSATEKSNVSPSSDSQERQNKVRR